MKKIDSNKGGKKQMRIKRKNGLKVAAITIALLLCLALAVGITGAWYQAKRQATGTLSMDQGIIIDYKGFGQTPDEGIWTRDTTTTFLLFGETNAQPGQNIPVNAAGIRANENSVNFYARVKLSYKFYNVSGETETEVTLANTSDLITTSANFFGTNWVDGGSSDGYYYYATGTTLNKFEKGATTFVDLFATDAKFVIEGAEFAGADNDGESGGFKIDDTTSINKIEVYLTLETLQGDATAEQAKALGWKIAAPVRFAEATGKMETSVNKTETTEDLNVSVAGATEVPINKVVFPYDKDTTLKFDSNNVEYITLTYDKGEPDIFDAETYEVAENTFKVNAKSSKGTVTGYTVGLWSDSEYTGFTYSQSNIFDAGDGYSETYVLPDGEVAITGYFGDLSIITILSDKVSVRERDFKTILNKFTDFNSFMNEFSQVVGSLQYPCDFKCDGFEKTFNNFNEVNLWMEKLQHNFTLKSPLTITYKLLCESNSVFAKKYMVTEIGFGAFAMKDFTKVTLSENITRISNSAFVSCENLEEIVLSINLTTIDNNAFMSCIKLTKIEIPSNVTTIGTDVFEDSGISEVIINSEYVSSLDSNLTDLFTNATKVYVKSGLTVGTYISGNYTKAESCDKEGYVLYTKRA